MFITELCSHIIKNSFKNEYNFNTNFYLKLNFQSFIESLNNDNAVECS